MSPGVAMHALLQMLARLPPNHFNELICVMVKDQRKIVKQVWQIFLNKDHRDCSGTIFSHLYP